jgi:hypothetical protein
MLLLSSTSVSSFAATNTITSEKFQSDTVKLPVESIPSRQLNFTQDTYLIAGRMRDIMSRAPGVYYLFSKFDEIWKDPANSKTQDPANSRKTRLFDHCKTQTDFGNDQCLSLLRLWIMDTQDDLYSSRRTDYSQVDELDKIKDELRLMEDKKP